MVFVYGKDACVQCDMTKKVLDKKGKNFIPFDVEKNPDAFDKVIGLGYQQVPVVVPSFDQVVLDADGNRVAHWSGFRPDYLNQL